MTIAGSDSCGGAGVQADLNTFRCFDTYGASVITVVTAQNPRQISRICPVPAVDVTAQLKSILDEFEVSVIKIGVLFSKETIEAIADMIQRRIPALPIVLDPVLTASSVTPLLETSAFDILRHRLLPLASIITPNIPEAERLIGNVLSDSTAIVSAARHLANTIGTQVLIKGGHRHESGSVCDYFSDGNHTWEFSTPYLEHASIHGSGCILASAIAANIAKNNNVIDSIRIAKSFVFHCLKNRNRIGRSGVISGLPTGFDEFDTLVKRIV